MVEALKDIVGILDKLPQYTIWVLLGVLFYKVVIIGSWFSIIRLLINRTYSYFTRPPIPPTPEPVKHVLINDKFVTIDASYKALLDLLDLVLAKRNYLRKPIGKIEDNYQFEHHSFLNMDDIVWMKRAVIEACDKEETAIKMAVSKPVEFPHVAP